MRYNYSIHYKQEGSIYDKSEVDNMLNKDTKVVVSGFGESEYPNIPTFQEISTLGESLKVIKEYLKIQKEYYEPGYLFCINKYDDGDFIYSYLDKEVTVGKMYKEEIVINNIIQQHINS